MIISIPYFLSQLPPHPPALGRQSFCCWDKTLSKTKMSVKGLISAYGLYSIKEGMLLTYFIWLASPGLLCMPPPTVSWTLLQPSENDSQTCSQDNLMETISLLRFSLPR